MQYHLAIYHYENDAEFRILDINGEPWFVLADVCRALEIRNVSDAAGRLDEDEKGIAQADTLGGNQAMRIVSESGLYSLILRSDKPQAKRLKKWVTSEVLPSIRRTGSYRGGHNGPPLFIRRYNENWDRVAPGHFSIISELTIRVWGRFEQVGHIMANHAPDGRELRPDVSVGQRFSAWLKKYHPTVADNYSYYRHWTVACEFDARQYPNEMLPRYLEFVDTVWLPQYSEPYFRTRDPKALAYLPKLLPSPANSDRRIGKPAA